DLRVKPDPISEQQSGDHREKIGRDLQDDKRRAAGAAYQHRRAPSRRIHSAVSRRKRAVENDSAWRRIAAGSKLIESNDTSNSAKSLSSGRSKKAPLVPSAIVSVAPPQRKARTGRPHA